MANWSSEPISPWLALISSCLAPLAYLGLNFSTPVLAHQTPVVCINTPAACRPFPVWLRLFRCLSICHSWICRCTECNRFMWGGPPLSIHYWTSIFFILTREFWNINLLFRTRAPESLPNFEKKTKYLVAQQTSPFSFTNRNGKAPNPGRPSQDPRLPPQRLPPQRSSPPP